MPTIDFITHNENTLRDFKPVLAKKWHPDWWKRIKVNAVVRGVNTQTIRACPAMDDWLKSGWYLLANRDLEVIVGNNAKEGVSTTDVRTFDPSGEYYASPTHPKEQFENAFDYFGDDGPVKDAFKMRNPWNIITPEGYSCLYLDPFLFQNRYFATWQGIIDTDKFNVNQDNSQIIFYPRVNHSFTIKKGTPLCQVIPFKREKWNSTYTLHSPREFQDNRSSVTSHAKMMSMDEQGRKGYSDEVRLRGTKLGPYRNEGYWQEKGKYFKEDEPPPECPMHKNYKDVQRELTDLNLDGEK